MTCSKSNRVFVGGDFDGSHLLQVDRYAASRIGIVFFASVSAALYRKMTAFFHNDMNSKSDVFGSERLQATGGMRFLLFGIPEEIVVVRWIAYKGAKFVTKARTLQ